MPVILIVEDDLFISHTAEIMIQDWGYDTLMASDVDEALTILRSDQKVDALFTDIYLKKEVLGGVELAKHAIKLRPNLRILYTTGNFVTDHVRGLFVKGTQCLPKPYTPLQLQNSVAGLLSA